MADTDNDVIVKLDELGIGCLDVQHDGNHYKQGIQPAEYIASNDLNFFEGTAIKHITRNRRKGESVMDLKKAIHYIQMELKFTHNIESVTSYVPISRD